MPPTDGALQFLLDLQFFGIKAGLENTRSLLKFLGSPERRFPTVHIAGTNGKGSTASMIASILTESGYRTGLYTSPHLIDFNERIRIDGVKISQEAIVGYTRRIRPLIENIRATFFEATTAMAFRYFADRKVEIAVIETGLGGRWDATNVITPLVSVITNIGLEHTQYLGKTIPHIAFEKGGIIKPGVPCVTGATQRGALRVLRSIAVRRRSKLIHALQTSSVAVESRSFDRLRVNLRAQGAAYDDLTVALAGDHQARNAQLAVAAIEALRQNSEYRRVSSAQIRRGLRLIRRNTGIRGRLEVVRDRPCVIADVAHNPDSVGTLVEELRRLACGNFLTVFGVMGDKDYRSMIALLAPLSRLVIAVRPGTERALEGRTIVETFQAHGTPALDGGSVEAGFRLALQEIGKGDCILVTGSHYVVGELLIFLNSRV